MYITGNGELVGFGEDISVFETHKDAEQFFEDVLYERLSELYERLSEPNDTQRGLSVDGV